MTKFADCPDCGYEKEDLSTGFIREPHQIYSIKECRECKIIISISRICYRCDDTSKCPFCQNGDLIEYKYNSEQLYQCPKCDKENLKFTITAWD